MKAIAVYCGSSPGIKPEYAEAAKRLGEHLARNGVTLIFGGGSVGLMGVIANAVLDNGGKAIGVITQLLYDKEVAHMSLTELHIVETMHERKALMAELADSFIAMPGGIGTLEELSEVMVMTQLGIHHKAYGILNIEGYYDGLIGFFETMVSQRFMPGDQNHSFQVDADPGVLVGKLGETTVRYVDKWLDHSTAARKSK